MTLIEIIKKDPKGIEFCDDIIKKVNKKTIINRTLNYLDKDINELVEEFKEKLNNIPIKYKNKPNHPIFRPLRKYYATGLRNAYILDEPKKDFIFQKLKELDIGIELRYYSDLRAKNIQNEIFKKFFTNGPGLYSSIEDRKFNSYLEFDEEFSELNLLPKIEFANNPEKYKKDPGIEIEDYYFKIFNKDWTDDYNERIFKLYGFPTRIIEEKVSKIIKNN